MIESIIIFSEPRSGSNVLCDLMSQIKQFRVLYEFFQTYRSSVSEIDAMLNLDTSEREYFAKHFGIGNSSPELLNIIKSYPEESLNLLNDIETSRISVYKIQEQNFTELNLDFLLKLPNALTITLYRKNRLKRFISFRQALNIDKWQNVNTNNVKIHFDHAEFIDAERKSTIYWDNVYEKLDKLDTNINLYYEDDIEQSFPVEKLSSFLSQHRVGHTIPLHFRSSLQKQLTTGLGDVIINISDVKSIFPAAWLE